jgi:hypothetical protein
MFLEAAGGIPLPPPLLRLTADAGHDEASRGKRAEERNCGVCSAQRLLLRSSLTLARIIVWRPAAAQQAATYQNNETNNRGTSTSQLRPCSFLFDFRKVN